VAVLAAAKAVAVAKAEDVVVSAVARRKRVA
jgi:hypothetical protein